MKKLAIFLAIMLIPFSAFALDTISDNDLNDVTGQAGVSIYTNSIQIVKTGVTTTYRDDDDEFNTTNDFNIVTGADTTKIFLKGTDPLMIDVIDMTTLQTYLNVVGLATNNKDFGDTAVMIVLPNAIEIQKTRTEKTYYSGAVSAANQMITVITSNAVTTISHADQTWGSNGTLYTQDAVWANSNANGVGDGNHTDQIGILITAHEDD
jgi:hypothetical protein